MSPLAFESLQVQLPGVALISQILMKGCTPMRLDLPMKSVVNVTTDRSDLTSKLLTVHFKENCTYNDKFVYCRFLVSCIVPFIIKNS